LFWQNLYEDKGDFNEKTMRALCFNETLTGYILALLAVEGQSQLTALTGTAQAMPDSIPSN